MKIPSLREFKGLVLLTVAAQHDEAYGVSIMESLEKQLDKKMNISSIHIALKRMEEKGFIESRFGGVTTSRGGRLKKFYTITAFGKEVLDNQYSWRTNLYLSIPQISYS